MRPCGLPLRTLVAGDLLVPSSSLASSSRPPCPVVMRMRASLPPAPSSSASGPSRADAAQAAGGRPGTEPTTTVGALESTYRVLSARLPMTVTRQLAVEGATFGSSSSSAFEPAKASALERMRTFTRWPHQFACATPFTLALEGFYQPKAPPASARATAATAPGQYGIGH